MGYRELCVRFFQNIIKCGCYGFSSKPEENILADPFECFNETGRRPALDYRWHFLNVLSEIREESPLSVKDEEFFFDDWKEVQIGFQKYVERVSKLLESDAEIDDIDIMEFYFQAELVTKYFKFYDEIRLKFRKMEEKRDKISASAERKRNRKRKREELELE